MKYLKMTSNIYISPEDLSYLSVGDAQVIGFEGKFIVHAEGNPHVIYKIWKEYEDEISPEGTDVFYTLKQKKYFRNHSEEVLPGLYRYRR